MVSLREAVKSRILFKEFGYPVNPRGGLLSAILSSIGPLKERIAGTVMYLKANERGRLLDVGCGNGQFLARMRELGWEGVGIEPDAEAVRIARERFGLEVFQGILEEAKFPEESFDVITMNHVIEHVPNPIGLLSECYRILKPSGKLVVGTPNIRSLGMRLFGKHWRGWEVPRHLFLFSAKSLLMCVEKSGFTNKRLWTTSRDACFILYSSYMIRRHGKLPGGSPQKLGLWLRLGGIGFWAIEYLLSSFRDLGEELVLEAVKCA